MESYSAPVTAAAAKHPPNTFFIGIDAGKHCGFAVWNRGAKKFDVLLTLSFWDCIVELGNHCKKYLSRKQAVVIVIEDVTQNKPTFKRYKANMQQWAAGKNIELNSNIMNKVSQDVGKVKRDTQLIMEWCERNKLKIIKVKPGKNTMTKLSQEQFNRITGWNGGEVSGHARDAAMLVYDK